MRAWKSAIAALALMLFVASSASAAQTEAVASCEALYSWLMDRNVACNACGLGLTPDRITEEWTHYIVCSDGSSYYQREIRRYCDYDLSCNHDR
jgi:hypothetical protein